MQLQELEAGLEQDQTHETAEQVTSGMSPQPLRKTRWKRLCWSRRNWLFKIGRTSIPYNILSQDVEADRALYESILTRLKESNVSKDVAPGRDPSDLTPAVA